MAEWWNNAAVLYLAPFLSRKCLTKIHVYFYSPQRHREHKAKLSKKKLCDLCVFVVKCII